MAITTFIGAENLVAIGIIQANYANKDYITEPEIHELARTLQTYFNDNKINAIVQDASISYAVYGNDYFKKEKIGDENRYLLASNLTTMDDLRIRYVARFPLEVHAAIENVISAAHNREIISKIKSDVEKFCANMTYNFDNSAPTNDEMIDRVNDLLDHYCGVDRKLTPEQLNRFKEAATTALTSEAKDRPRVYQMFLYIDNDGCIRVAKPPNIAYIEIS